MKEDEKSAGSIPAPSIWVMPTNAASISVFTTEQIINIMDQLRNAQPKTNLLNSNED